MWRTAVPRIVYAELSWRNPEAGENIDTC